MAEILLKQGDSVAAVVTAVEPWGLFVSASDVPGLVSYDPTGSDSGKHVTLGETVRVIVGAYDPIKRRFSGQLG